MLFSKLTQFMAIAFNVTREIMRQPFILLMSASCILIMSALPLVVMFNFGEEGKLVRDGALALHFVFGLAVAVASASMALRGEIMRGTAATVLCKPVSRTVFLLATYCGILVMLILFSLMVVSAGLLSVKMSLPFGVDWRIAGLLYGAMALAFLLAAAVNAGFDRPFVSRAFLFMIPALLAAVAVAVLLSRYGHAPQHQACCPAHAVEGAAPGAPIMPWGMVPAGVLIAMALAVLAAIALALSTRLAPIFTVAGCVAVFFLGLISDYLFAGARHASRLAAFCYAALPNWQDFWMVDALSGGGVSWSYVGSAGLYASLYVAGALCLAVVSFADVEIT